MDRKGRTRVAGVVLWGWGISIHGIARVRQRSVVQGFQGRSVFSRLNDAQDESARPLSQETQREALAMT